MKTDVRLAELTTLRVGGPADRLIEVTTEEDLIAAVRDADAAAEPVLLVSGGSNMVVADEGFRGTVIKIASRGIRVDADACSGAMIHVAAGEDWDEVVQRAIAEEWSGLESMSGIPGLAGSTPVQNVGAYGHEVAETIASVRVWDRVDNAVRTIFAADCGFSYRTSRFKADPARYAVLEVAFQLPLGDLSAPIGYAELARVLDVETGSRAPMTEVREAVLGLRRSKGMVLDEADHDTWSAGSFFTNPLLDATADVPAGAPQWPQPDGRVKTSAGLADRARRRGQGIRDRRGGGVVQAHAGADQPWRRVGEGDPRPGRARPGRGAPGIRYHPRQRARPGELLTLTPGCDFPRSTEPFRVLRVPGMLTADHGRDSSCHILHSSSNAHLGVATRAGQEAADDLPRLRRAPTWTPLQAQGPTIKR
ncbi:UDP-N-acetylmuramate dehydrogenase [Kribbella qitaiheensis]|uniref:UDP-N-acetylmuramate dehydrogenase n=1 Tax=Kribbella qitaiheensis TaxID=1544730 RepID=UPI003D18880D